MKKTLKILSLLLVLVIAVSALTSCDFVNKIKDLIGGKTPETTSVTITWYDGNTVLKTQEITKGGTVSSYTPAEKAGYVFQAWYADANFTKLFDFTAPINENVSIYAAYVDAGFVADESSYYLIGDGRGDLSVSNWDHNASMSDDNLTLKNQNVPGKNVFSTTIVMYAGDRFQICHDGLWDGQVGIGRMEGAELNEAGDHATVKNALGIVVFEAPKNEYHADFAAWDITLAEGQDGIYTFTYTTYADPTKNVITWEFVEKLDASDAPVANAELYFVGTFNNWDTGALNEASEWILFDNGDGTWEGTIVIETSMYGDWTLNEVGTLCAALKLYDKANDKWIGYNGDGNLLLKEGVYLIVYDVLTGAFTCEILEDGEIVEGNGGSGNVGGESAWYVRGTMSDWNAKGEYLLLSDDNGNYSITLELAENDIFKVATSDWSQEFGFAFVEGNPNFAEGTENGNIVVVVAGTYTITVTSTGGLKILGEGEEDNGEPVVPSEPEDITLYYYTTEWTAVNLYAWNASGEHAGTWPGTAMTAVEGQDGWFTITINASVTGLKVIFNDGTSQTANLSYAGLNYWVGGVAYETLEAAEEAIANPPVVEPVEPEQVVLYVKGTMNGWSDNDEYLLAYDENGVASITVTLVAGDLFKVSNSDWSVQYKYSSDLGANFKEGAENNNIEVVVGGTYVITVANGVLTITLEGESSEPVEPSEPVDPSEPVEPSEPAEGTLVYLAAGEWASDEAWFAAWVFGGAEEAKWVVFTKVEGTELYATEVPADCTGMVLVRLNPANTNPDWETKWNQSVDLTLDGENNLFTFESWGNGGLSTFTAGVYAPVVEEPVEPETPVDPAE